jgi:hypothetical protein
MADKVDEQFYYNYIDKLGADLNLNLKANEYDLYDAEQSIVQYIWNNPPTKQPTVSADNGRSTVDKGEIEKLQADYVKRDDSPFSNRLSIAILIVGGIVLIVVAAIDLLAYPILCYIIGGVLIVAGICGSIYWYRYIGVKFDARKYIIGKMRWMREPKK